jgi:hypothetical protein
VEDNFKCTDCSHTFLIPRYSFQITSGTPSYKDSSTKKLICCPECQSTNTEPIDRPGDLSTIAYGKFSSASDEKKKSILRKRAKEHNKKTEEQYHTIDREFRGKVNEKHY